VEPKQLESFLDAISRLIWNWPLIISILAVGIYFSYKLKMLRFSNLKLAMKCIIESNAKNKNCGGDISVFASICTALSATLGTGNIVGIAVAVTLGGPGSIFWLWISSILSLAVKYAEGVLAIKYRKIAADGSISGGPMYYIRFGLGRNGLAKIFAFFGLMVALIGTGTLAQSNSIAAAFGSFGIPNIVTATVLSLVVMAITMGGLHRISAVAEKIVPIMTLFYIGAATAVLVINFSKIPQVFYLICSSAFMPKSILGGGVGITATLAASVGVSRGIFSHEAGLGSSAIAAATAKTDSPAKQGLAAAAGALLSIVVCTMTALVIVISCDGGAIFNLSPPLEGAMLTAYAFEQGLGVISLGKLIVSLSIILFAFTTIIGWNYYGEKCIQYIWGDSALGLYKIFFVFFVALGPFFRINTVLALADIVIGLMAISNLIGLIGLRKIVIDETEMFFRDLKKYNIP
jgi:AGCS family alanine or glycine:cation symporter